MPIRLRDSTAAVGRVRAVTADATSAMSGTHTPPPNRAGTVSTRLDEITSIVVGSFEQDASSAGAISSNLVGVTAAFRGTLSVAAWATQAAVAYLPAVPGARGFGMDNPHGLGTRASPNATILTVDRLTASSSDGSGTSGSLAWCLTCNFPRIIIFAVSGTIALNASLNIDNNNFYVAGETAPFPGIFIRSGLLNIRCRYGVVSHINSYMGGDNVTPIRDVRDTFSVAAGGRDIVISNCSGFWGCDESAQVYNALQDITYWQCLHAEPLDRPAILTTGELHHGYNFIVAGTTTVPNRVSILRNAFVLGVNRNPLCRATNAQIADNIVYNWGRALPGSTASPTTSGGATVLGSQNGVGATNTNVESCLYLAGPDHSGTFAPINSEVGTSQLANGSRCFQTNNRLVGQTGSITANAAGVGGMYANARIASAWSTYTTTFASAWTSENFIELHRRYVGACPAYTTGRRNLQFTRMRNYLAGSGSMGQVIDEVSDVSGGWSNIPSPGVIQNTVDHTTGADPLPASPNAVQASGYTAIEEWLHRRIATVMP